MNETSSRVQLGEVEVLSGIEYAQTDSGPLALDLYRPAGVDRAPTVLYLHGGGWAVGDRSAYAAERLVPVAARGGARPPHPSLGLVEQTTGLYPHATP